MTKLAASLTTIQTRLTHQLPHQLRQRLARAGRSDRGSILEYVIVAAGVCVLAIALIAVLTAVVAKYTANIK